MATVSRTMSVAQEHELLLALYKAGITSDDAQRVIGSKGNALAKKLVADIRGEGMADPAATGSIVRRLVVDVDHSQLVEDLVADGRYDSVSQNITPANFPHQRQGLERAVLIGLIQFQQVGTTAQREIALASYGELCDMDDQLSLGLQYPDEQRQHPIVFLGAWLVDQDRYREVGVLGGDADWRDCRLYWDDPGHQWDPAYVFAVRLCK